MTISFTDVFQRQRSSSLLLVCFCFCQTQKPTTLGMLDALHCFILILCCFSFFFLDFLKRIYLFVVGINTSVGMPRRGCEGQRRAWVLILGVCFVSDRLCSFSTTKPGHLSPFPVTPGGRGYFRCSRYGPGLLSGWQIHSGSHASTFTTELFPSPPSLCETGS